MFEYFLYTYGAQILLVVLCALAGTIGFALRKVWKVLEPKVDKIIDRYIDTETKQNIAKIAAQFVEQKWQQLHGPEKLEKALETAELLLKKKGIDFDAEEMMVMIEAVVAEFNEAFRKPLDAQDTAAATVREIEDTGDVIVKGFAE